MNKTVLITGASSGFGYLTTNTLLKKGYTVIATMRNLQTKNEVKAQEIRSIADGTSGTVYILELDVSDDLSVENAVSETLAKVDSIDIVINNAGIGVAGLAEAFSTKQWQNLFNVNVFGVNRVMKAVLPFMRAKGEGLIINISSVMGRFVIPFAAPYTAAKFALESLTETYKYEVAHSGIDVVLIEPGGFGTGFGDKLIHAEKKEVIDSYGSFAEIQNQMWGGMFETIQNNKDINPQLVADAICHLIETSPKERPFRTVVDPLSGGEIPNSINKSTQELQSQFMDSLKMGDTFGLR